MKLYMVVVGGDFRNSNVELHDVRFCVGGRIEECYADLHRQWWGEPASLHLDGWAEVNWADGHEVTLAPGPVAERAERLFFVNLGGYDPTEFGELHKNVLMVAPTAKAAVAKALAATLRLAGAA
jgi:hypothetical protein